MEPPSAPPKSRSSVLFAIVAIVLLFAGVGAGYLLGRPAPATPAPEPGPVTDLARPNTFPRVQGWFQNTSIVYLDYGVQPNVAIPILVFFQASSPDMPVSGQRNIIDAIPGQPGYSDFWRVYKVLTPSSYVANSIRSLEDAFASGYPIEETNTVVNCPVVNPNATTPGSAFTLTKGWYRDREVSYFDHGPRSASMGFVVATAPIYAFFRADGTTPVAGQQNVIDVQPGMPGYSDLWNVVKVIVDDAYVANTLKDARSILAARDAGDLTLQMTSLLVNCPVVS